MSEAMSESMSDLLAQSSGSGEISERFRGFLPIVVDVETGGFNASTDALLEVAAVPVYMDSTGLLHPGDCLSVNIEPFSGANIEESALQFTGIDLEDLSRNPVPEKKALKDIFAPIKDLVSDHGCSRAVLVAHNAHFDLGFINAACERNNIKRSPFHPFTCFDTATLAGLAFGQTVLAKSCEAARIPFSSHSAHAADYDAKKTAELFCQICNTWTTHIGNPG